MKITRKDEKFVPIIIELETKKEVDIIRDITFWNHSIPDLVSPRSHYNNDEIKEVIEKLNKGL